MMAKFRVHAVRFYAPEPRAVHCLTHCNYTQKLALSRSDNSVEIWDLKDSTAYQEKIIMAEPGLSVESLLWCQRRLFSVGLTGVITEFDLVNLRIKKSVQTSFGACWCAAANSEETHLAIGTEEGYLCMFFVSNETLEFQKSFDKQEGRIMCLSWHVSGDTIVSGSVDIIRVWDVRTGHAIQRMAVGRSSADKETIIWCIAITEDYQIISGDSRGHVSFWDAQLGVLIQSIQSHHASILCLNLQADTVCVAGVDPQLIEYRRVKPCAPNQNQWVQCNVLCVHTHDVRAMTTAGKFTASGGVDSYLVFNNYPPKVVLKYSPLPNGSCAQVCASAHCLLLQYSSRLELWRLGSTHETAIEDNKRLALSSHELLLVEVKTKEGEQLMASAISADASWLAYSTNSSLRLFQIITENAESETPRMSVVRVRFMPKQCGPARCLQFDEACNRLIALQPSGDFHVLKLDIVQPVVLHHFKPDGVEYGCHLLSISKDGGFAAIASHCGQVIVIDMNEFKVSCSLPQRSHQATAMAFMPNEPLRLVVAYQDRKIRAFNIKCQKYESWSLDVDKRMESVFSESYVPLRGIAFDPSDDSVVILHDDRMIYLFDTRMLETKCMNNEGIRTQRRYEHLVYFSNMSNNFMVAVEVSPLSLVRQLPPQLKQKKYGT